MASFHQTVFSLYAILEQLHIAASGCMIEVWPIKSDHSISQFKKWLPSITPYHLHALLWKLCSLQIRSSGQIDVKQKEFDKLDNVDINYQPFHLNIRTEIKRVKGGYTSYNVGIDCNDSGIIVDWHLVTARSCLMSLS